MKFKLVFYIPEGIRNEKRAFGKDPQREMIIIVLGTRTRLHGTLLFNNSAWRRNEDTGQK